MGNLKLNGLWFHYSFYVIGSIDKNLKNGNFCFTLKRKMKRKNDDSEIASFFTKFFIFDMDLYLNIYVNLKNCCIQNCYKVCNII